MEVYQMSNGQSLVIQGSLLGCFLLAAFGWIVTADAAALQLPPIGIPSESGVSTIVLPPMVERLHSQTDNNNPEGSSEELFDASIAYTPEDFVSQPITDISGSTDSQNNNCQVSQHFPESILGWCWMITQYAEQNNLEPNLIAAVMLQESGGQHLAYSHSGAVGLMQVMPRDGIAENFICKNGPCFSSRPTIAELQEPEFNIAYGTRMLAGLEDRFGNIRDALKSYGPMDVGYSYADKVLALLERYGD
jgi:hypothetical protein